MFQIFILQYKLKPQRNQLLNQQPQQGRQLQQE